MTVRAALANALWLSHGVPDAVRMQWALSSPEVAQRSWLLRALRRHVATDFGRTHDFARITGPAEFARRVPLADHAALAPWIERIRLGERHVLTSDTVTHLAPTSGTSGGRKLVPFTASLQQAFAAAVNPWLLDLARQRPALIGGPAYWSVSPQEADASSASAGEVPIGFADDTEYLGGATAWLVRHALAVPQSIRHVSDERAFWRLTLLALLRQRRLRLISVWHPTFLELLVGEAESAWAELLEAVREGTCPWLDAVRPADRGVWTARPDRDRAAELRGFGPHDWPNWWQQLQVVSCWGDQAAEAGWQRLRGRIPEVLVQAKGLLATEAVVTVPLGAHYPLAVTSHFFEFLDKMGNARLAHELELGAHYEVIVTNGGGLWRYRLGDVVECTGHMRATPTLRFLGRAGVVSDLRGEKLADAFVAQALRALWNDAAPVVAELHAWDADERAGYTLRVSDEVHPEAIGDIARRCDALLAANPNYAIARRLGQLAPVQVDIMPPADVASALRSRPGKLGDMKPRALVRR